MDTQQVNTKSGNKSNNLMIGLAMIVIGGLFLLDRMNMINALEWWYVAPAMIAIAGVINLFSRENPEERANGLFQIILAFWLFASAEHLWGWTFRTSWPVLIIGVGLRHLVIAMSTPRQ